MPGEEPKAYFYVNGVNMKKLVELITCIEDKKLTRVSDITRICNINWGSLYKYLLHANTKGFVKIEYIKPTGSRKARGIIVKPTPKFYELVKAIEDLEKRLEIKFSSD